MAARTQSYSNCVAAVAVLAFATACQTAAERLATEERTANDIARAIAHAGGFKTLAEPPYGYSTKEPLVFRSSGTVELTRASASQMSTAELAQRLLPADQASEMASHEIGEPFFAGGPMTAVRFFSHAKLLGEDLCWRDRLYVSVSPVGTRTPEKMHLDVPVEYESTTEWTELAAAPQCRLKQGGRFAQAVPRDSFNRAVEGLRLLLKLQHESKSRLPEAAISCRQVKPIQGDACAPNARQVFAELPLGRVSIIESKNSGWEFSIMPESSGEFIWNVELTTEGVRPTNIAIIWKRPAPF